MCNYTSLPSSDSVPHLITLTESTSNSSWNQWVWDCARKRKLGIQLSLQHPATVQVSSGESEAWAKKMQDIMLYLGAVWATTSFVLCNRDTIWTNLDDRKLARIWFMGRFFWCLSIVMVRKIGILMVHSVMYVHNVKRWISFPNLGRYTREK